MLFRYFVVLTETFESDRLDIFIACKIIKVKQILLKILKYRDVGLSVD
jgi:hypothetical protein